tara:strand:- start:555 stop:689 length:135 start_codon:yes stop_codon:yes gene_type:complete
MNDVNKCKAIVNPCKAKRVRLASSEKILVTVVMKNQIPNRDYMN